MTLILVGFIVIIILIIVIVILIIIIATKTSGYNWKSTLSLKTFAETSGVLEPELHTIKLKTKPIIINTKKVLPNVTAQGRCTNLIV